MIPSCEFDPFSWSHCRLLRPSGCFPPSSPWSANGGRRVRRRRRSTGVGDPGGLSATEHLALERGYYLADVSRCADRGRRKSGIDKLKGETDVSFRRHDRPAQRLRDRGGDRQGPELRQIVARLVELRAEGDRAMAVSLAGATSTVDTLFQRLLKLPGETDHILDPVENALSQLDSESARFISVPRLDWEMRDLCSRPSALFNTALGTRSRSALTAWRSWPRRPLASTRPGSGFRPPLPAPARGRDSSRRSMSCARVTSMRLEALQIA